MSEWTKAQEADFQALVHRASEQSRDCYRRRKDDKEEMPRPEPIKSPEHRIERCPEPPPPEIICLPRKDNATAVTGGRREQTPVRHNTAAIIPTANARQGKPHSGVSTGKSTGKATGKATGSPSAKGNPLGGLGTIMEKLDNEGIMLAMLLWLLIEEKADNSIILAIAYILLV